jgi:hypothetical protein
MVAFTCKKHSQSLHIQHTAALTPDPLLLTDSSSVRPKERVTSPIVDLIKKLTGISEHPKELVAIVRRADSRVDGVFFGAAKDGPMYSNARVRKQYYISQYTHRPQGARGIIPEPGCIQSRNELFLLTST